MKISVKDKRPRKLEEWDGVYENAEAKGNIGIEQNLIDLPDNQDKYKGTECWGGGGDGRNPPIKKMFSGFSLRKGRR